MDPFMSADYVGQLPAGMRAANQSAALPQQAQMQQVASSPFGAQGNIADIYAAQQQAQQATYRTWEDLCRRDEFRRAALREALVALSGRNPTADEVVECAKVFADFLRGAPDSAPGT